MSTLVQLFGTIALAPATTVGQLLFAGADGVNAGVASQRLMPPPRAGVIRRVTLRTITPGGAVGFDYYIEAFASRVQTGVPPGMSSRAAFWLGRSLAPVIPAQGTLDGRDMPDLDQVVEWPYILQDGLQIGGGDPGAVPAQVPGLLVRLTIGTALPDGNTVIGVGIEVESRVPDYPPAPFIQRGGDDGTGAVWPANA